MKPFEKNIQLKKGDTIEILFYDNEIDCVKVKDDNTNKIKVTDEKKTIKRIRVRRPLSEHLDEIIFNSDNEIKGDKTMELKDIVLKEDDIVWFTNNPVGLQITKYGGYINKTALYLQKDLKHKITKIERKTIIYEAPKQILDKKEKEYLENFLRPFKEQLVCIVKTEFLFPEEVREFCYLRICYKDTKNRNEYICLPNFKSGTMYKGMKLDKGYTLEELGLFKE